MLGVGLSINKAISVRKGGVAGSRGGEMEQCVNSIAPRRCKVTLEGAIKQ